MWTKDKIVQILVVAKKEKLVYNGNRYYYWREMGALKITKVDVRRYDNGSNMKALASVVLDDCFIVRDIRVIEGNNGLFVAMPSRKVADGYRDVAHPLNQETRNMFSEAILDAYQKAETEEKTEEA